MLAGAGAAAFPDGVGVAASANHAPAASRHRPALLVAAGLGATALAIFVAEGLTWDLPEAAVARLLD